MVDRNDSFYYGKPFKGFNEEIFFYLFLDRFAEELCWTPSKALSWEEFLKTSKSGITTRSENTLCY